MAANTRKISTQQKTSVTSVGGSDPLESRLTVLRSKTGDEKVHHADAMLRECTHANFNDIHRIIESYLRRVVGNMNFAVALYKNYYKEPVARKKIKLIQKSVLLGGNGYLESKILDGWLELVQKKLQGSMSTTGSTQPSGGVIKLSPTVFKEVFVAFKEINETEIFIAILMALEDYMQMTYGQ